VFHLGLFFRHFILIIHHIFILILSIWFNEHPFTFISHVFLINVYLNCKFILTILYLFCILSSLLFSTVAVYFFSSRLLFSLSSLHDRMLSLDYLCSSLLLLPHKPNVSLLSSHSPGQLLSSSFSLMALSAHPFLSLVLSRAGRVHLMTQYTACLHRTA